MYTCVRALIRHYGVNERLIEAQVDDIAVRDLATEYSQVILILTHTAIQGEVSLDISTIEDLIYQLNPDVNVEDWLSSLDGASLPTSTTIPTPTAVVARYNDAFNAGYDVQRIHPLAGDGTQLPDRYLTDLRFKRIDTDYQFLFDHCLVTVNGLLHLTDYSDRGLTAKGGGTTIDVSNDNQIGIISFKDVGEVISTPIELGMIRPYIADAPLKKGILIKVPGADFTQETAMISFGGILFHSNCYYKVVSDDTILLEWWKIPFWQMYYRVAKLIDVTKFDTVLNRNPLHGDAVDLEIANGDQAIRAFLTLDQSFIIRVKGTQFYTQRHGLERTSLPGRYYAHALPRFPLQLENGLLPAYLAQPEDGVYVIQISKGFSEYKVHETRDDKDGGYVHSGNESRNPHKYAAAYLLEMGRDL